MLRLEHRLEGQQAPLHGLLELDGVDADLAVLEGEGIRTLELLDLTVRPNVPGFEPLELGALAPEPRQAERSLLQAPFPEHEDEAELTRADASLSQVGSSVRCSRIQASASLGGSTLRAPRAASAAQSGSLAICAGEGAAAETDAEARAGQHGRKPPVSSSRTLERQGATGGVLTQAR